MSSFWKCLSGFFLFILSDMMGPWLMTGSFKALLWCKYQAVFFLWIVTFLHQTESLWDLGQHKKAKYWLCDNCCLRIELISWKTTIIAGAMSVDWNKNRDISCSLIQGVAASFCFSLFGIRLIWKGSSMLASITLRIFFSQRL